jgi:hypothetical protein
MGAAYYTHFRAFQGRSVLSNLKRIVNTNLIAMSEKIEEIYALYELSHQVISSFDTYCLLRKPLDTRKVRGQKDMWNLQRATFSFMLHCSRELITKYNKLDCSDLEPDDILFFTIAEFKKLAVPIIQVIDTLSQVAKDTSLTIAVVTWDVAEGENNLPTNTDMGKLALACMFVDDLMRKLFDEEIETGQCLAHELGKPFYVQIHETEIMAFIETCQRQVRMAMRYKMKIDDALLIREITEEELNNEDRIDDDE